MDKDMNELLSYRSLDEIRAQKSVILDGIRDDDKKLKELWKGLFNHSEPKYSTPSQRLHKVMNISAGIFDGAVLGWKLYRKFNGKSFFKRF